MENSCCTAVGELLQWCCPWSCNRLECWRGLELSVVLKLNMEKPTAVFRKLALRYSLPQSHGS